MSSTEAVTEVIVRPQKTSKRFECPRCHRQFSRLEHLQRHERTHTQERPFACVQCESRFTRSDLLIRHERLSHNKEKHLFGTGADPGSQRPTKRLRIRSTNGKVAEHQQEILAFHTGLAASAPGDGPATSSTTGIGGQSSLEGHHVTNDAPDAGVYRNSLEALSLAAEHSAFNDNVFSPTPPAYATADTDGLDNTRGTRTSAHIIDTSSGDMEPDTPLFLGDLDVSFDDFAAFLEAEPYSNQFMTSIPLEQPTSFPQSIIRTTAAAEEATHPIASRPRETRFSQNVVEEQATSTSFSRFGSRLPSLQPDEHEPTDSQHGHTSAGSPGCRTQTRRIWHISSDDRQRIVRDIAQFETVPRHFQLPTRMSLARYIRAYVDGFHEHMPFLHVQTLTVDNSSVELLLAMCAVGAQYCFEAERGVEIFHVARAIATERIRRRDARIALQEPDIEPYHAGQLTLSVVSSPALWDRRESFVGHAINGPLGLPSDPGSGTAMTSTGTLPKEDLMQSAQALLILMAMATWAKHKEILREALAIQSILASLVRDDGLRLGTTRPDGTEQTPSWEEWIRRESVTRTKYIVFCFFNLHSIVYDIPPLLLNWEIAMPLPCSTAEFKAESEASWREAAAKVEQPSQFQSALRWLFSKDNDTTLAYHSALGNYVLIHAIIQHIFLVRQTIRCRVDADELTNEDVAPLEQALRRWQMGWNRNPESSIDPSDPNGPVAFNSTALLRLAYIRLNMDTGPGRALGTRDPVQIAQALREMPAIKRTPKLVRALLHSAHALSIPVKIGVRLVSRTQAFIWSIQHSLCSLECALLLTKWLETVSDVLKPGSSHASQSSITGDERKILALVMTMLDETEFAVPPGRSLESPETAKYLSAGVLRVWATIFRGAQTWAIVDVIGSSLNIYADMLEAS